MKVRLKSDPSQIGHSGDFNTHSLSEILVYWDDDIDSDYMSKYDVLLSDGNWKDLKQAFKDKDVITDNHNTCFAEPKTEEERERGYF
jgi:hypothetical protein